MKFRILQARLQIDYLCTAKSDKEIKNMIQRLPNGLGYTYQTLLCGIAMRYPTRIVEVQKLFRCLVTAAEPLTACELSEVLAMEPDERDLDHDAVATDPFDALEPISALVRIEGMGALRSVVKLCHYSFQEYLCSHAIQQSPAHLFHIDKEEAHAWMTGLCLQYLTLNAFDMPIEYGLDLGSNNSYAFRRYAAANWFKHAMMAENYWLLRNASIPFLGFFVDAGEGPPCYKRWQDLVANTYFDADFIDYSPICICIWLQLNGIAISLIHQLPSLDHNFENGLTCLAVAAKENNLYMTNYLLHHGANPNKPTSEPDFPKAMTPIHFAAEYCALEVLETLLEHGADPHIPSTSGATPFYRACRGGNLDIVKRLKGCGCDINVRTWDNWTPMIEAVENDHESIVDILIEWDADVSTVTEDGTTALSIAEALGQLTIVGKFKCAISGLQETTPNASPETCRE
jgi:hypothetical protein